MAKLQSPPWKRIGKGGVAAATNYWKLNEPPRPRQSKERDHLLDGASTPPLPRSIQSCPAGQLHNRKEVGGTKTKNLSAYFLERRVLTHLLPASAGRGRNAKFEM